MFLRHKTAARVAAAYLLFIVASELLPRADIPETLFDEANTSTNEMVVPTAVALWEFRDSGTTFEPIRVQSRRVSVRGIVAVYDGQLTDCRALRQRLCTLLC
jgi:hypothetical protein